MTEALAAILPWAHALPSWDAVAIILSLIGAALCLLTLDHPRVSRLVAALSWLALVIAIWLALRGLLPVPSTPIASLDGDPNSMLVSMGIAIVGVFVWLLDGDVAIDEERRKWLAPLAFTLAASAIGTVTASDLLVLVVWQLALGANVFCLVLMQRAVTHTPAVLSLLSIEVIALLCAGAALAILGVGLPADARSMGFAAIGLAMLMLLLAARLASLTLALPPIAKSRGSVLALEIAVVGMAIPAALHPLIALAEELRTLLPSWFVLALSAAASLFLLGGGLIALAVRERGARLAAIAASLIGLGILGACEASKTALLFVLLWLGPMPAFLAASSVARRIDENAGAKIARAGAPQADAVKILLALACLAIIGVPPFAGFWARLILIQAAWGEADYTVIAITLLSSLVLALALARRAFERAERGDPQRRNSGARIALPELLVLGIASGATLAGGLYPAPFIILGGANAAHGAAVHRELTVGR